MSKPTTRAVTWKQYRCVNCGHDHSVLTNHYGEIYLQCPECRHNPRHHVCLEPCPDNMDKPVRRAQVKLGDVVEIVEAER